MKGNNDLCYRVLSRASYLYFFFLFEHEHNRDEAKKKLYKGPNKIATST